MMRRPRVFAMATSEYSTNVGHVHGEWQVHTVTKNDSNAEQLFPMENLLNDQMVDLLLLL